MPNEHWTKLYESTVLSAQHRADRCLFTTADGLRPFIHAFIRLLNQSKRNHEPIKKERKKTCTKTHTHAEIKKKIKSTLKYAKSIKLDHNFDRLTLVRVKLWEPMQISTIIYTQLLDRDSGAVYLFTYVTLDTSVPSITENVLYSAENTAEFGECVH